MVQKVIAEITMSLDGFVAGPAISVQQPMGKNGERLHDWMFTNKTETDTRLLNEIVSITGAVITGNHTYKIAIDLPWGGKSPFVVPAFVVCHHAPSNLVNGFTYVTGGILEALSQARKAAGDKHIWVMGGASIIQQFLAAGVVDYIRIHIAPILLGNGTRLFEQHGNLVELKNEHVVETPAAVHAFFKVIRK